MNAVLVWMIEHPTNPEAEFAELRTKTNPTSKKYPSLATMVIVTVMWTVLDFDQ